MPDLSDAAKAVAHGASLEAAMALLCRAMARRTVQASSTSVMRYDVAGNALVLIASHGLPDSYVEAIRTFGGVPVEPASGSCGTAAYRRTTIVVDDIEGSPLWIGTAHLPLSVGLRSCWSAPILSRGDELLGTVAVFRDHTRWATPADLELGREAARHAAEVFEAWDATRPGISAPDRQAAC